MMQELNTFFAMQGYGVYIWSSVLLTIGILLGNVCYARKQLRNAQQISKEKP